ncbi:FERM and PDZ domain-containing protein 1 isoform X2 [Myripristis murdjan]|uniref:FERM and PDZ domain-containing protein 1 isoform X2 n=1 Tax=Myripristis murdjan TaxID=586833 RepID=UPI001175DEAE|nr:FERM and PDZ domain-containing protein 1-like isoform X2 [Myripristis murdjan]
MEERDRSRSPSRKTSRVEQVVGRWLRRSRDLGSRSHSLTRERGLLDGKTAECSSSEQRNYPFRFNVQIHRDPNLNSHGLTLSSQTPILVQDVTSGGPADGRLVPGDQLVKINNVAVDDLTPEQAAEIIRECQDTVTMTVLRTMMGPKSSFITPEKRAKLRSNPVKVRFAEEVEVNGHSQGNALLFLPNVLKVYLENGQTKAFKFEPSTTVKDIVMTLKEKLSLCRIEHFSLVLEQQHSVTKLLLLHDEERIQQVVQKREAHDYRCLFRVCFMPKAPQDLLLEDPTAFEYLYLQGVNDVLQERFAVEMRCNTALRLAALHIQERLASCGQSPKTNLKMITKTWGIENFVSSTLLRNMREKDLRKAIGYHMKKSQSQQDPKQKILSANQARINYLEELSDLKSFGGKSFSATMMLQDRESMVTLLVGARYGVSQVVNHKLSIMTTLTEFSSITRIELLPESDKVSLVKIYLQDIKPITLLLESVAAKDLSCLIAGYCRVFVEPNLNIFPWAEDSKKHRVSAEEGYVSRCGSDSDNSSDLDMDPLVTVVSHDDKPRPRIRSSSDPDGRKRKDRDRKRHKDSKEKGDKPWGVAKEKDADTEKEKSLLLKKRQDKQEDEERKDKAEEEKGTTTERAHGSGEIQIEITGNESCEGAKEGGAKKKGASDNEGGGEEGQAADEQPSASEASDSCRTDSRVVTSPSSDSLDALEEDDLISCSSSAIHPHPDSHLHSSSLHPYPQTHPNPHLLAPPPAHSHPFTHLTGSSTNDDRLGDRQGQGKGGGGCRGAGDGADPHLLPPISSTGSLDNMETCAVNPHPDDNSLCFAELSRLVDYLPSPPEASEEEDDEEEELRRRRMLNEMDGARSLPRPLPHAEGEEVEGEVKAEPEEEGGQAKAAVVEPLPILHPPPGFGDSSSDEEFFDARDHLTSPEDPTSGAVPRDFSTEMKLDLLSRLSLSDIAISVAEAEGEGTETEDIKKGEEEGGGRETLFQLRKRSRKRRSFMETDFTSRVSYPEPDVDSNQDMVSNRLHWKLLAQADDGQMLSSDPEPSEQTQNPCPTVSSLTHSEGEPAQLESKPILSKPRLHGAGSQEQNRDLGAPSRAKKQEMEMEPDSMEYKSVTDLVEAASPSITVVRCRVEPDGKESADRRGDGKEEGEGQGEIGERKGEGDRDDLTSVSGNGPFTSHMFLPEIIEEEDKDEETGNEGVREVRENSSSSKRPLTGAQKQLEANTLALCLIQLNIKGSNVRNKSRLRNREQSLYGQEYMSGELVDDDLKPLSYSPPPPPPTSPVPPLPVLLKSNPDTVRGEGDSEDMETSSKMSSPNHEESGEGQSPELPSSNHIYTNKARIDFELQTNVKEDDTISIVSTRTASDSINSDSVFDDDEASNSLNASLSDKRAEGSSDSTTVTNSISANTGTEGNVETQTGAQCLTIINTNSEAHTSSHSGARIHSVNSDYAHTINSITAKLGAATSVTSPTFNSGITLNKEATSKIAPCSSQNVDTPKSDSIILGVEASSKNSSAKVNVETTAKDSFATPGVSLAKANTAKIHNISKQPPSPTHFLFQTCSPSIMGRLSASTLRGKIQKLPLYLSRSQETLNQVGVESKTPCPTEDISRDDTDITIKITDVHDVTKTVDLETVTDPEAPESDDSDATVTGSDVEGDLVVKTTTAEIARSAVSEVKEVKERVAMVSERPPLPVQTEPKPAHQSQPLSPGLNNDTPGPIIQPPSSIVGNLDFQRDTPGPKMDTPGPIKEAPESKRTLTGPRTEISGYKMDNQSPYTPPPIVVTTQNLNGPGVSFHNQSEKVRRTSSDRPLMGLCRPTGEKSDSLKALSSGCGVFAICEEPSQTKTAAQMGSTSPLKPGYGCSSVLASGCESVVEGIQVPVDACSCPAAYTNCFSGGDSFDDELTVYEFSCRTQISDVTQTSGAGLPLMTTPPGPSFLSSSPTFPPSSLSPSFPRSVLFSSTASELSPLLSPLSEASDCLLSQTHKDTINRLSQQRYPEPPAGFQILRGDVDQLISILEGGGSDRSGGGRGGRHPRDTCPAHFTENKQVLHIEARQLMASCQKVVGVGQTPEEMLLFLADSFRTLVELAGVCLWFSGCDRCDRRNAEAVAGLADVARSFRDFCLAAERASGKRSCQDLSTKLLAKQCTALTASVFCLTQVFRTLTAL